MLPLIGFGCAPPEAAPPNLVLVVVDTLRADALGCYGFAGESSPQIDALAREAVLFENCISQAPWTKPAAASLLTSLYPDTHGLTDHAGRYGGGSSERRTEVLPEEALTLAEVLRAKGYRTAAFVANTWMGKEYGFAQGFELYDDYAARLDTHADEVLRNAKRWLEHSASERPFFLYLHFMDVHAPYDAQRPDHDALLAAAGSVERTLSDQEVPYNRWQNIEVRPEWATDPMRHELSYWRTRYAAGVRAFDRRLSSFIHHLRRTGALASSVLALTSDHGEHLFEHGDWSHGQNLYEHQLRVPLVVRLPGGRFAGRRVSEVVELVDVMPTLLSLLDVVPPRELQGRSLVDLLDGSRAPDEGESRLGFATAVQRRPGRYAVRSATHKLIHDVVSGETTLFDLRSDPGEQHDISASAPDVARQLSNALEAHLEELTARGPLESIQATLSDEDRRRLEALGYTE